MNIMEMTRELGKALQQDKRYIEFEKAKETKAQDEELQEMIRSFEMKRIAVSMETTKTDKDEELIANLNSEIKTIYDDIMRNSNMITFANARDNLDGLVYQINQLITLCANGEDPETCEIKSGCSGSCESCSGCH